MRKCFQPLLVSVYLKQETLKLIDKIRVFLSDGDLCCQLKISATTLPSLKKHWHAIYFLFGPLSLSLVTAVIVFLLLKL